MHQKTCTKCYQLKSLDQFKKQTATKDGLSYYCKSCLKPMVDKNNKKRYQQKSTEIIAQVRVWQKQNKEKVRIYNRTSKKRPIAKIKANLRKRIKEVLGYKDFSLSLALGCTPKQLRCYLQAMFRDGMTWDNYGTLWSIDHIKPLASFDLSKLIERKKANHYSNLQPLLISENTRKGASYGCQV